MKTEYIPPYTKQEQQWVTVDVVVPGVVNLALTLEEALYIVEICNRIGGTPSGPRGNYDRIRAKLIEVIPENTMNKFHANFPELEPGHISIYFKNEKS